MHRVAGRSPWSAFTCFQRFDLWKSHGRTPGAIREKKYVAEFIGTFALVFCGTGAIVINDQSGGAVTHAGVAITFGLVVAAMIYSIGELSGAHLNPAVTLAFWFARLFPGKQILPYVLSQCTGGFIASFVLKILFPANETLGATLPAGSDLPTG